MNMTTHHPQFEIIVVDTEPIIRGELLTIRSKAKELVTIQEVIEEVRDSASKDALNALPLELKILAPRQHLLHTVIEFAKKTGDISVLSDVDLKVIALTLTMAEE